MKRFVIKVLAFFILMSLFAGGFCYFCDPFNVMHVSNLRFTGVEPNKNYIKTKYIIDNPDKFDTFIVGSSTVGHMRSERIGDSCYNMTYSSGTPSENYDTIFQLITHDVNISTIYLGVDYLSTYMNPEDHYDQLHGSYTFAKEDPVSFWSLFLDPSVVLESIPTMISSQYDEEYVQRFYRYGWDSDYDFEYAREFDFGSYIAKPKTQYFVDDALVGVQQIVAICSEHDIQLVVFTNPIYAPVFTVAIENGYLDFLQELAYITPYYNFSTWSDISADSSNYLDPNHHNTYVSSLMIDRIILNIVDQDLEKQGFGTMITPQNVESQIAAIRDAAG